MAKYGGFGGGMGNMQQLMRQAQKLQEDMMKAKEELAEIEVTGTSGGGLVEVVMTCDKKVLSVSIKPEAVDVDDIEMLEDLLVAALNDAAAKAENENNDKLGAYSQLGL